MKTTRQPEVNIGLIGHVDHGKTTLTQALTGRWTDTHSEELKRGISIRLGYADAAFYKCPSCPEPEAYSTNTKCAVCGAETKYLRTVSFVDAPGHETLMATMLGGAAIMDGALLLAAANERCPQPQTKEHLMAIQIVGIQKVVVAQNKVDLVPAEKARENHKQITAFVQGTIAESAPIVPVCAQQGINVDALIMAIERTVPTPQRDAKAQPRLAIARSFDVNRPGAAPKELRGGVVGGSIQQGTLKVGDEVEILPGRLVESGGKTRWDPITTEITGLVSGSTTLESVGPGGLVGVATKLDPALTKGDAMVGRVLGRPGSLPPVRHTLTIDTHLLERVVGTAEELKVDPIRTREALMLSVGTATTVGVVSSARAEDAELSLKLPVCAQDGQRVAISRRIGQRWRLVGHGVVK